MSGLTGGGTDAIATLVAALATLVVLGGLLGERRVFGWSQHLFAGLVTGYLALLAVSEVIVPRIVEPIVASPGRLDAWLWLVLAASAAGAPWLPRVVAAVPISIAVGALAAFALGGAVVGTILPQLGATIVRAEDDVLVTAASAGGAAITGLVLVGFLHGTGRGSVLGATASLGRWLMLAGIGGWLGYLLLSRLVLLVDRVAFLLGDWLGLGR